MDILLAQTIPAHDPNKSDLETTLNVNRLTAWQKSALMFPLPLHPMTNLGLWINPTTIILAAGPVPIFQHSTASLEWYFKQEALAACLFSAAGARLINDFFSNTHAKREIPYPIGSLLSEVVRNHDAFKMAAGQFEASFFAWVADLMASIDRPLIPSDIDNLMFTRGPLEAPELPFFKLGDPLGILGHFQEIRVRLVDFIDQDLSITMTFQYDLIDHFGADDSDLDPTGLPTHGTPGQIAMWILARAHPPGHKPFVVKITTERKSPMLKAIYRREGRKLKHVIPAR